VLLMTSLGGNAYAAACATQEDRLAIRAAAIQQRLMVSAYICNAVPQYNKFVLAYRGDLQQSDDVLKGFFRRSGTGKNDAAYHAFKTRLANMASLESGRDPGRYCAETKALFNAAFSSRKTELAVFIEPRPTKWEKDFPACKTRQVARAASN
jgi:hypothetical protein